MHKFFWAQAEELQQFVSPSSQQGFAHYLSFSIRTFDFFSCLSLEFCEFHPTDVAPLSSPVWIQDLRYLCHHTNQLLMGTGRRSSSGPTWAGGIQPFLLLRDWNCSTLCSCFAPVQPWEQRILQPGYLTSASPPRPSGCSWNYIDLMWFAPEKSVLASSLWFYYLWGVSIDYFTLCPRIFPRNGVGQAEGSLLGFLFFLFQSQGIVYSSTTFSELLRNPLWVEFHQLCWFQDPQTFPWVHSSLGSAPFQHQVRENDGEKQIFSKTEPTQRPRAGKSWSPHLRNGACPTDLQGNKRKVRLWFCNYFFWNYLC